MHAKNIVIKTTTGICVAWLKKVERELKVFQVYLPFSVRNVS